MTCGHLVLLVELLVGPADGALQAVQVAVRGGHLVQHLRVDVVGLRLPVARDERHLAAAGRSEVCGGSGC